MVPGVRGQAAQYAHPDAFTGDACTADGHAHASHAGAVNEHPHAAFGHPNVHSYSSHPHTTHSHTHAHSHTHGCAAHGQAGSEPKGTNVRVR